MSFRLRVFVLLALWVFPSYVFAREQEVTITSREVVERLTRLEEGQKALTKRLEEVNTTLNKRIDDLRAEMNQRFDDVSQRFVGVNQRFDDVNRRFDDVNNRFAGVNQRFDDVNNRFNDIMTLLQIIISTLVALVLAIAGAGFVMWRKILTVDAAVQTKFGLDQAVKEQVLHLEQEIGFVKGKLQELSEALGKR
ncbi:MAG: hypothetical protein HY268_18400 [Deltaproteobacteria bacterium]|nr:hypothetical protein [Deltaproteobacteria bacterium]